MLGEILNLFVDRIVDRLHPSRARVREGLQAGLREGFDRAIAKSEQQGRLPGCQDQRASEFDPLSPDCLGTLAPHMPPEASRPTVGQQR